MVGPEQRFNSEDPSNRNKPEKLLHQFKYARLFGSRRYIVIDPNEQSTMTELAPAERVHMLLSNHEEAFPEGVYRHFPDRVWAIDFSDTVTDRKNGLQRSGRFFINCSVISGLELKQYSDEKLCCYVTEGGPITISDNSLYAVPKNNEALEYSSAMVFDPSKDTLIEREPL